ncbi:MAG: pyruvate ferredoxin oxidoreductase, partial [Verrucomicrobia bacterium]|nr:pyruvate ferredoxin oxidoreductase [Verrucomicrobiota bacterium]
MTALSFPSETLTRTGNLNVGTVPPLSDADRKGLTKKEVAADHPTWCPGCGDFSVLALYFKLIEKRKMHHEKITTVA